jgi:outer membrane protein assembly factor BamB
MPLASDASSLTLRAFSMLVLFLSMCGGARPAFAQDVLTYHNSNARTGVNNKETILTTSNVNAATFGKLFTLPTDGLVDAEPLFLSAVSVGGVVHDLVIVASEHGTVYAYDADTGANVWHVTTLKADETTSDNRGCSQVTPEIGITSTPVILRPKTGNPVIFVVAMSKDSSGKYHQRLHALDATTGAEVRGGPVDIAATYPGTGDNSSGGNVIFDPGQYKERAGLLLVGNNLYLAWASHCDIRPYTGWIMGYNATTLARTTVLNLTPNGNEGAIWNSGAGTAADGSGNILLLLANGVFDTTLNASGFPVNGDYGNAFLRVTTKGGLAVGDYFEMDNEASENGSDTDLGSGGRLLVNQKDSTGKVWQLAVGGGKGFEPVRGRSHEHGEVSFREQQYLSGTRWSAAGWRVVDAGILQWDRLLRAGRVANSGVSVPECQTADLGRGQDFERVRVSRSNAEHLLKLRTHCDCVGGGEFQSCGLARIQCQDSRGTVQLKSSSQWARSFWCGE